MALPTLLVWMLRLLMAVTTAVPAHAQTAASRVQPDARVPSAAGVAARTLPRSEDLWEDNRQRQPAPAATFRTICVRLCDGFYFPISFQTTRQGLQVDAARCAAKCSGAQLFFHANPGGNVASARSFTGLQYESLPNAFRHLKALVPKCGCTPEPWSVSEQQRHRAYAKAERSAQHADVAAQNDAPPPITEDARPLAQARRAHTADRHDPRSETAAAQSAPYHTDPHSALAHN